LYVVVVMLIVLAITLSRIAEALGTMRCKRHSPE